MENWTGILISTAVNYGIIIRMIKLIRVALPSTAKIDTQDQVFEHVLVMRVDQ